jgi:hypothetical protein
MSTEKRPLTITLSVLLHRDQRLRIPHPHHSSRSNDLDRFPACLCSPVVRRIDLLHKRPNILPRRKSFHLHRRLSHDPPNRPEIYVDALLRVLSQHGILRKLPDSPEHELCERGGIHEEEHGEFDGTLTELYTSSDDHSDTDRVSLVVHRLLSGKHHRTTTVHGEGIAGIPDWLPVDHGLLRNRYLRMLYAALLLGLA